MVAWNEIDKLANSSTVAAVTIQFLISEFPEFKVEKW